MEDSGYGLYELACDCIGTRISELSAQLHSARSRAVPDQALIDDLKRRSSALWMERHELSWGDESTIETCQLSHGAHPERMLAIIALVKGRKVEDGSA